MEVLVINVGNSSFKYQLANPTICEVFAKGPCECTGIDGCLTRRVPVEDVKYGSEIPMSTRFGAIQVMLGVPLDAEHGVIKSASEIGTVGHRVAHGGEKLTPSARITDEVMAAPEEYIPLVPLHNPANITGIRVCEKIIPGVPMMGVLDTTFHQTISAKSYIYALPYESYEQDKVRRYSFHDTSHRYVSARAAAMSGKLTEELKIITYHPGNGSSVAVVDGGKSVDTSMGFTLLAGVPVDARAGDLGAGILKYLMGKHGYDIKETMTILNKKSGVLGISDVPSDFHDLEDAAKEDNQRAELAPRAFQYSVKKLVGAYAAAMGGVDAIVFTTGVGKNDAATRMVVASGLELTGVKMDAKANNVRGKETVISSVDFKVKVLLIPIDEEPMIAMDTAEIVGK